LKLIHGSSTGTSNAATDRAANDARNGIASGLAFVVKQGGFTSNGGWRGAVGKNADYYARQKLNDLINEGVVVGPLVDVASWKTLPGGGVANHPNNWRLAAKAAPVGAPGTTTPGYTQPVLPPPPIGIMAPGGGTQPLPPAPPSMATPPTFAPPGTTPLLPAPDGTLPEEPSPSQKPQEAGLFAGLANLDTTGKIVLAGSGLFLIAQVMGGGRRRNPRRRR